MNDTAGSMSGKRVLIVEDDFYIVQDMVEVFEASGAVVIGPAANAENALQLLDGDGPIDGVVLDINLYGDMSYAVADTLKRRRIPFVFATGYDRSALPPRYRDAIVCLKPVSPASVGEALFGGPSRQARA